MSQSASTFSTLLLVGVAVEPKTSTDPHLAQSQLTFCENHSKISSHDCFEVDSKDFNVSRQARSWGCVPRKVGEDLFSGPVVMLD